MNGVRYYRCLAHLSRGELAKAAGIDKHLLAKLESPADGSHRSGETYVKVSEALSVKVDELLRDDLPETVQEPKLRPSRTEDPQNPITRYRRAKCLTLAQLGKLMGNRTKETARLVCAGVYPYSKYLDTLAANEKLTPELFLAVYGCDAKAEGGDDEDGAAADRGA